MKLDDTGYADKALADHAFALSVARHKSMFFREKDAVGNWVDYLAGVSGALQLIPDGPVYQVLADDYGRMLNDGMLSTRGGSTTSWQDARTSNGGQIASDYRNRNRLRTFSPAGTVNGLLGRGMVGLRGLYAVPSLDQRCPFSPSVFSSVVQRLPVQRAWLPSAMLLCTISLAL